MSDTFVLSELFCSIPIALFTRHPPEGDVWWFDIPAVITQRSREDCGEVPRCYLRFAADHSFEYLSQ